MVLLCMISSLGIWLIFRIPSQAEAAFGTASPNLAFPNKLLLSLNLLQGEENLKTPVNSLGGEVPFQIGLGETPVRIVKRLEDADLVHEAGIFLDYLVFTGLDTQIQAGNYWISPANTPIEIAHIILDATPKEVPFAILAGWRLEEIAETIPSSGLQIDPAQFLEKAYQQNLEGYLLPGVYIVQRDITIRALFDLLISAFDDAISADMTAGFKAQGLTVEDAVRLASIVEREAILDNEKPLIASVFINRLAAGMKLEADPTVQYAVGYNPTQATWWTNPLSIADLAFDSPFNTYIYTGLPPTPICNPSIESLRAVAFPALTPYYYFRATCDESGSHNFAETYDAHIQNECP